MKINYALTLIFPSLVLLAQTSFGYQEIKTITVDASVDKSLNLSEIAESVKMIVLEPVEGHPFFSMNDIVFDEDYIFISGNTKILGEAKFMVLQYSRDGKLIRQLGADFSMPISLIYNPDNKRLGLNEGEIITFYDYEGNREEVVKTVIDKQIYFSNHFWGIHKAYSSGQWSYNLKRTNLDGSNINQIFEFSIPTEVIVGEQVRFSVTGDRLYFWDNYSYRFYEVLGDKAQTSIELKFNKGLSSRSYTQIKGDWIVIPALDQRRRMSLIKYINLRNGRTYSVYERTDGSGTRISGIVDDISGAGILRYYDTGPVYGDVDNKLVFIKNKGDVPQLVNNPYSDNSSVFFIVTLK